MQRQLWTMGLKARCWLATQILVDGPHWRRGDVNAALYDAYLRAEVKYLEVNDLLAGSCSLSVVLQNNTLHLANCGDCRAVLQKVRRCVAHYRSFPEHTNATCAQWCRRAPGCSGKLL